MKKELMYDRWNFILYEENSRKIIDVDFFNSFVDYSRQFLLKGDELEYNFEQLKELAVDIRNNYEKYKDREILKE